MRCDSMRAGAGAVLGILLSISVAAAQSEVGTLVAALGTVELQRGGSGDWRPALVGATLFQGDHLRTNAAAAAQVLFRDDSLVGLAAASHLAIERYAVGGGSNGSRSLLHLLDGKLRALVSAARGRARFEVETPTAVVRIKSTEFIVMYNAKEAFTEVVSLERAVEVQGTLGLMGPGVEVGAGQMTRVQQGGFPSPPRAVAREALAGYLQGMEIVGTGSRESLDVGNAAVSGSILAPGDRPEVITGGAAVPGAAAGSFLESGIPAGESLAHRLSPDLRTNTQSIPEYRTAPPGEQPSGAVDVDL